MTALRASLPILVVLGGCAAERPTRPSSATGGGGSGADPAAICESRPEGRKAVALKTVIHGGFALLSDGTVWCWGEQPTLTCWIAGIGDDARRGRPQRLPLPCAKLLDADNQYALISTVSGETWMWGDASAGSIVVASGSDATWIDAGTHNVAWGNGTETWWWGDIPWLETSPLEPEPFPYGDVDKVSSGPGHICYLSHQELWCFGFNRYGQFGDGTVSGTEEILLDPVRALVPVPLIAAQATSGTTSALDSEGNFWTWGRDLAGQERPSGPLPAEWDALPLLCGFDQGDVAGCGWGCDGRVDCWGYSPSNLFEPEMGGWHAPTRVRDLEPAAEVSTYVESPLCARKTDGTVWCRGLRGNGDSGLNDDGTAGRQLRFEEAP